MYSTYIGKSAHELRTVSAKSLLFCTYVEKKKKPYEQCVVYVKYVFHSFLQFCW